MKATWMPHEKHGRLTTQSDLPDSVYAFPKQRKEPLTDASHVRNAIARLDQVEGVSPEERDVAFANIKKAAEYYGVELSEGTWHDVGIHPEPHATRVRAARKAGLTRKKTTRKKATRKTTARKTAGRKTTKKKSTAKKTRRTAGTAKRRKTTRKKSSRKR